MTDFIKENVEDFQVVVLTVADTLNEGNTADGITGGVDYLKKFVDATQDRCADFTFWGGLFFFTM